MAQKKITDLQLRSAVSEDLNFPSDDGIQSYRVTGTQLHRFILSNVRTISAGAQSIANTDRIVLLDPTSASFTQALPACASFPTGFLLKFKNIATNGNQVTLDANSTELIDNAETLVLNSDVVMESVTLYNTGTKWLIL